MLLARLFGALLSIQDNCRDFTSEMASGSAWNDKIKGIKLGLIIPWKNRVMK